MSKRLGNRNAANDKPPLSLQKQLCPICYTVFAPNHQRQKFCSAKCRYENWLRENGVHVYECFYCGKQYTDEQHHSSTDGCDCPQSQGHTKVFIGKFVRKEGEQ